MEASIATSCRDFSAIRTIRFVDGNQHYEGICYQRWTEITTAPPSPISRMDGRAVLLIRFPMTRVQSRSACCLVQQPLGVCWPSSFVSRTRASTA